MSPTLNAFDNTGDSRATVVIATDVAGNEVAATLRWFGHGWQGQHNSTHTVVIDFTHDSEVRTYTETTPTLQARMGTGGNQIPCAFYEGEPMQVRRLTPIECERLMGWPDNHTLNRADGKTNSDTTRYKMCGNGVASPVAQWIAEQINNVEQL